MRSSDWSSDVCSSDLFPATVGSKDAWKRRESWKFVKKLVSSWRQACRVVGCSAASPKNSGLKFSSSNMRCQLDHTVHCESHHTIGWSETESNCCVLSVDRQ